MTALVGKTVSEYRILARLGAGGMGEVYLGEDLRLGRKVAVKFLARQFTRDPERVRRFEIEARSASALNHPNIVTVHDIGESEAGRFIVMESVEGRTLRGLVGESAPAERVCAIGAQIARALAVAHEAGIVHRDIKPDNVMVRLDGYVKVLDFGLVRLVSEAGPSGEVDTVTLPATEPASKTEAGAFVGTATYMSPEQARCEPVGSATDLFSLGILLYELATGRHPFRSDSRVGTLHAIIAEMPVSPARLNAELPTSLESLILQLLEKDPRARPSAAEAAEILEALSRGGIHQAAQPGIIPSATHTVGRAEERARLRAAFNGVSGGRGAVVCVSGEPGIGKTTLVSEFLGGLIADGPPVRVARGRCSERLCGAEAYLPIFEALDDLIQRDPARSVLQGIKSVAPTWYLQIAPVSENDSSALQVLADAKVASQERMKREFAAFLAEVSRIKPLVLHLDDVHWADAATVDLLSYVGTRLETARVLILATYRLSELQLAEHPFLRLKLDLQGRGIGQEIPLGFLGRDDIGQYLALEFPGHKFPDDFPDLIHTRTEGSPLFMVDLVRYLRDRGVIAEQDGDWVLAESVPDVQRELPESVRSMIERKIERLTEEDRRLLVAASVQGHEFDAAVVARAMQIDAADVEERLEGLDRIHRLVDLLDEREFPDNTLTVRFRFVHALYQNVLYASLKPTRRATLSAAVAAALMDFHKGATETVASQLALLFEAARKFESASDYFLVAARNAGTVHANEEAAELYQRSIALAERLPDEKRHPRVLKAALECAALHKTLSCFEEAHRYCQLARKTAEKIEDVEAQITAICGSALAVFNLKRISEMRHLGEQALTLARSVGSRTGEASAEGVMAMERTCSGDLKSAEAYFDRAVPVLQENDQSRPAFEAVLYRGMLYGWQLRYARAEPIFEWSLRKAREFGDGFLIVATHFFRGMSLGNAGRLSEALCVLEEGRRLAELNGERHFLARLPNTIAWVHRELQDYETALRLDSDNVPLAIEAGMAEAQANAHVNLGHDYRIREELDRAHENYLAAQEIYKKDVWYRWRYNIRLQAELAEYWTARGDLGQAAAHAEACLQSAEATGSSKYRAWGRKLVGDVAALEERTEEAATHYGEAMEVLGEFPCPTIEWKILNAAADVQVRLKNGDHASELRGRARSVVQSLVGSVDREALREGFLRSEPIRRLFG